MQVRGRELAQSLLHALGEREQTCQRTCYSLQLQGVALDPLSELGAVEGLAPGAVLRLIEGKCLCSPLYSCPSWPILLGSPKLPTLSFYAFQLHYFIRVGSF